MYRDLVSRMIMLKRGEIISSRYCRSGGSYYAFDDGKWMARGKFQWPVFYKLTNSIDPQEMFAFLKDFLLDEPEAFVFFYPSGIFAALKLAEVKNEPQC